MKKIILILIITIILSVGFSFSTIIPINNVNSNIITEDLDMQNYSIININKININTPFIDEINESTNIETGKISGTDDLTYIQYLNGVIIFRAGE